MFMGFVKGGWRRKKSDPESHGEVALLTGRAKKLKEE